MAKKPARKGFTSDHAEVFLNAIKAAARIEGDPPIYGHVMPFDRFCRAVEDKCFIDYDGHGTLMLDGKLVQPSTTNLSEHMFIIGQNYRIKLSTIKSVFGSRAQVCWYNK